jgi:multidrug efflux pump subunit AcrA (membrane-fusion protein)
LLFTVFKNQKSCCKSGILLFYEKLFFNLHRINQSYFRAINICDFVLKSTVFLIVLLGLACCTQEENKAVSTYKIVRRDFENSLSIDGFIEPVHSSNAVCPPDVGGQIGFLVEDGTFVEEGEVVCIVEVPYLQTDYDELLVDLENAKARLTKSQADLAMEAALLDAQIKNNEAQTQIAMLDSLQIKYSTPNQVKIKELELKSVGIEKDRYEKKLKSFEIIQQSEIKRRELQVQRFTNRLQAAKEQLDAMHIKAPKSGLAMRATFRWSDEVLELGDMVYDNMILVIIPELSEMKVRIQAPEADFKMINIADSVVFTFDAMPENKAFGKITAKFPAGQVYKQGSKVKFYEVEASIDSTLVMPEPGLTANCHIILSSEKDTLVIPQIAVFEEDSMKVVYVKDKKGFEMRQVQLGLSSQKEVVVAAGLKDNEEIAMSRPRPESVHKMTNK